MGTQNINGRATRARRRSFVVALALALAAGFAVPAPIAPAQAQGRPDSFADLAAAVSDAVVNISVTQAAPGAAQWRRGRRPRTPGIPRGTPFDDLLKSFFKRAPAAPPSGREQRTLAAPRNLAGVRFVIIPQASSSRITT